MNTKLQQAVQQALEALESGALLCELTAASMLRKALADEQAQAVEPVAWWIPKAEQFCLPDSSGQRPFAKAWEPLYTRPAPPPSPAGERAELIAGHDGLADELKAQQVAVPAGYALVPIEPTQEMIDAMTNVMELSYNPSNAKHKYKAKHTYQAMLAAAQGAKP